MKRNPLETEPGLVDSIKTLFPGRHIPRGPILFLGPYTHDEVNEARARIGLKRRHRKRNAEYFAEIDTSSATYDELVEVFSTFLKEYYAENE